MNVNRLNANHLNPNQMNVNDAIQYALANIESDDAAIDARYLLSFVLDKSFTWIKTWPDETLTTSQIIGFKRLVERRSKGEPIAYITGEKDFWSLTLKTNSSTLIPRSETELLVEQALEFLSKNNIDNQSANILDLGTGTGAIALSIAKERPQDNIVASDFSEEVVQLAEQNIQLNQLNNVQVIQSDWFNNIPKNKFNLIVSNPPYVEENDPHLQQGDLVYEPNSALVASDNGLSDIKQIIQQSTIYLKQNGALMIEHGFDQALDIRKIYASYGFESIMTIKDLAGLDRITVGVNLC